MLAQTTRSFQPSVDVLMTRRPICVEPTQPIEVAASLMRGCRIRHLPVVDGQLVGILSLRDVVAAPEGAMVANVMSPMPEVTSPSMAAAAACERMLAGNYSCLPVVENEELVGIFTATDALAFAVAALEEEARDYRREPSAAQLMTARPLVIAKPTDMLATAWKMMRSARVRHVPVMREDAIVGLLSDRDVLAAGREWLGDDAALGRQVMLVADAMSRRVSTVEMEHPAVGAGRTLLRRRIGALPVLRGGELRGILTVSDFLYWILARA
jgi:CBS domain-containing membrane protein